MLEIEDHKKIFKLITMIVILSVVIFFCFLPVAMFGNIAESQTDNAVNSLDTVDGQNTFTPGKVKNATMLQKVTKAF